MAKPRKSQKSSKKSEGSAPKVLTPEVLDRVSDSDEPDDDSEADTDEESEPEIDAEADSVGPLTGSDAAFALEAEQSGLPVKTSDRVVPQHDLLRQYLDEVSRYPLLTPEEEFSLAVRLRDQGDLDAAKQLVRANLRLVVKIAMEYRSAYQNVLDLIQEGNVGLMKAVSKFDPSKGAKLSYYSGWWIRSYILKYILDNFRLVKVGTTQAQKKLFFHLMREKERLEAQGLNAGPKLLADKLNVREKDVVEMEQRLSGRGAEMSLNNPLDSGGEESGGTTHLDFLESSETAADDSLGQDQLRQILKSRLSEFAKTLKEKELVVFQERLAADEPKTLQEVADKFGLTRERARQIETRVIEKLREYYGKYMR